MSIEVAIICNDCGRAMGGGKTAAIARGHLAHTGAACALPGGVDYCWDCAPRHL
jgi:hypothetical protein